MPLYRLAGPLPSLDGPIVLAAFDGWVDAGSAATSALAAVAQGGVRIADFDPDELFDYRSRRPT
ncbi:MAG TPA: PAC2 family protein, partial [Candidatus Limnocylindrales bacterium]